MCASFASRAWCTKRLMWCLCAVPALPPLYSPGWGVGIFQEALDLLVKQKAEGKDEEWGTSDPTSTGLEYSKGDRVECKRTQLGYK